MRVSANIHERLLCFDWRLLKNYLGNAAGRQLALGSKEVNIEYGSLSNAVNLEALRRGGDFECQ